MGREGDTKWDTSEGQAKAVSMARDSFSRLQKCHSITVGSKFCQQYDSKRIDFLPRISIWHAPAGFFDIWRAGGEGSG